MFQLSKVLFPVDFSNRCRGAARVLDALHDKFQLEVTLAHVLPPPHLEYSMADLGGGLVQEYTAARTEQARKDLEYFLDEELRAYKLKRILLEGDPARKLIEYAHDHQMDLIVMPTHGYGGFRRFMLGSVTAKVLHDADCPVLTGVHMEDVAEAPDLHIDHVAVAVDLGESSEKVLRWGSCFARKAEAKLSILHVTPSVEGLSGEYFEPNWKQRFFEEADQRIAALQKQVGAEAAEVLLDAGPVPEKVASLAKTGGARILVIGRGSTSGVFGRIRAHAYSIIRQSPCPVVSV